MNATNADLIGADRQHQVIERLRQLVEHETPSGDIHALEGFATLLQQRWRELAIESRRHATPGGPVVVGDLAGAGWGAEHEPILLITHSDTVWPAGTSSSRLPWSRNDGIIRGPGVFDMKSGIAIIETLIELLHASGAGHPPVRILVAPDEETGSTHSRSWLEHAATGCCAALGFESPHPDGSLKIGRFGSTRVRVTVVGREAHAALDAEHGISAIDELVDQLLAIRTMVSSVTDVDHPVLLNIGSIDAVGKTNVVSGRASAQLGLRFSRPDEEAQIMPFLTGLSPNRPGAEITVDIESHRPAWGPSLCDVQLGGRLLPGAIDGTPSRGAADTNTLAGSGIPVVDGLGASGGGAHALSEHIAESTLWHRISALYAAFSDEARWPR